MCGVDVPQVSAHGVGGALQRPREQGQLSPEAVLIEALGVRGQPVQVLTESAQRVLATPVDHVAERCVHHRHVLGQEEVFHLHKHTGSDGTVGQAVVCRSDTSGVQNTGSMVEKKREKNRREENRRK